MIDVVQLIQRFLVDNALFGWAGCRDDSHNQSIVHHSA